MEIEMKKALFALSCAFFPTLALADVPAPVDNGPADSVVHALVDSGKVLNCDGNGTGVGDSTSCKGHDYGYQLYYNPSKTVAIAWVAGYPMTGGSAHGGALAEFRDHDGWQLVQVYKTKRGVDGKPPEAREVTFLSPSSVRVTYHYLRYQDPLCCATGRTTEILPLK